MTEKQETLVYELYNNKYVEQGECIVTGKQIGRAHV